MIQMGTFVRRITDFSFSDQNIGFAMGSKKEPEEAVEEYDDILNYQSTKKPI